MSLRVPEIPGTKTRNYVERSIQVTIDLLSWGELRCGDLRIYYDIAHEPQNLVTVVAVGIKDRDRVFICGEEVKL